MVEEQPPWLRELIAQFEREPVTNPPGAIYRYDYQGQTVYYVPPRCCDIPGSLYDAGGTFICAPDGGFTGGGDGRCRDFFGLRENGQLIWQDRRR